MSGQLDSEDELVVFVNDKLTPIYELDTMDSLKLRLATQVKNEIGNIRPILPFLLRLEEKVDTMTEEVKIPIKGAAGCHAIHVRNPQLERINPLAQRKFRMIDFPTLALLRITSAGLDRQKQWRYADELMDLFDLPNLETYVKYVLYFSFEGLDRFETRVNPVVRTGFIEGIQSYKPSPEAIATGKAKNLGGIVNFDLVRLHYDNWAEELDVEIRSIVSRSETDMDLFFEYREKLAGYETITSGLQLDKTFLSVKFAIATDLYELFNGISLSPEVPFCAVGDFFKVFKTFKPPNSWAQRCPFEGKYPPGEKPSAFGRDCQMLARDLPPGNEMMVIYVLNRLTESERNKMKADARNYSTIFIIPGEEDEKTHELSVEMIVQSRIDDELREEKLLSRIFESFPFHVAECSYEQKRVEADFLMLIPGDFDIPLFQDMVLTDPLISQLMLINERSRTFRERGGIYAYFRYNQHVSEKNFLACRINPGIVEAKDQSRAPDMFKSLGKKLLRITLRGCKNQVEAERFRDFLTQILELYFS